MILHDQACLYLCDASHASTDHNDSRLICKYRWRVYQLVKLIKQIQFATVKNQQWCFVLGMSFAFGVCLCLYYLRSIFTSVCLWDCLKFVDWAGWSFLLGVFFAMITPENSQTHRPGYVRSYIALQLKQGQLLCFPCTFTLIWTS